VKSTQLTIALNDPELVHNEATLEAVFTRLRKHRGNKADLEGELVDIGNIVKSGNVPTATGEKVITRK
jgi:hypothetical protein